MCASLAWTISTGKTDLAMLPDANRPATADQSAGNCQPVSTVSATLEVDTSAAARDLDLQLLLN